MGDDVERPGKRHAAGLRRVRPGRGAGSAAWARRQKRDPERDGKPSHARGVPDAEPLDKQARERGGACRRAILDSGARRSSTCTPQLQPVSMFPPVRPILEDSGQRSNVADHSAPPRDRLHHRGDGAAPAASLPRAAGGGLRVRASRPHARPRAPPGGAPRGGGPRAARHAAGLPRSGACRPERS